MLKCQHCGQEHSDTLKFCPQTGKSFSLERILPAGTLLEGKYRLGRAIGVGGMGTVFEATHVLLHKRVAIKVLLPEFAQDLEMSSRMVREARAASAIGHRNIVDVTDMGYTDDRSLFMVMEFIEGKTLDQIIKHQAPLPIHRTVFLITLVLSALETVHKKGIIHRDLKPNNIIVFKDEDGQETLKVLDFGISKVQNEPLTVNLTTVGKIMGTPQYMSPEQALGEATLDHRTDIYSCGAILYECLSGAPPLTASNYNTMIALLVQGTIEPLTDKTPPLPAPLNAVVMRALARKPEDRFPDAATFRQALEPFRENHADETGPELNASAIVAKTADDAGPPISDSSSTSAKPKPNLKELELAPEGVFFSGPTAETQQGRTQVGIGAPPQMPQGSLPPNSSPTVQPQVPPHQTASPPSIQAPAKPRAPAPFMNAPNNADEPLELMEVARPRKSTLRNSLPGSQGGTLYQPPKRRYGPSIIRLTAIILILGGVGFFLWQHRDALVSLVTGEKPSAKVSLVIETLPKNAKVVVDGIPTMMNFIWISRSDRMVHIKAKAKGYQSKETSVRANHDQTVILKLDKIEEEKKQNSVLLSFQTSPLDAQIWVDGHLAQANPLEVEKTKRLLRIKVSARGYKPKIIKTRADRNRILRVKLIKR